MDSWMQSCQWAILALATSMAQPALAQQAHAPASPLAIGATLDSTGRVWIARMEDQRLVVTRSDDDGRHFIAPVAATTAMESVTANAENRPKINVGADGIVHLSWTQNSGRKMTWRIRHARSTDGGRSYSEPVVLNDERQIISHHHDALAGDGAGGVAVVWLDARGRDGKTAKGSPQTQVGIYAAVSTDGGASFGRNRKIADHSCQCCRTGLTWTTNGPVAFWRHVFGKNIRDFAIADLNGGPVRRVTDDEWEIDGCPHHGGGIAAGARGKLHITWFTNGKKRQGIFYRRIGTDGMSDPLPLGDSPNQAGHPAVAAEGERVLVTWREFDGQRFSAWAMLSHDGGTSWGVPQKLAEAAQQADYTLPLIDAQRALVVWNTAAEGLRVLPVAAGKP